jgi:hypothetical protein
LLAFHNSKPLFAQIPSFKKAPPYRHSFRFSANATRSSNCLCHFASSAFSRYSACYFLAFGGLLFPEAVLPKIATFHRNAFMLL